MTAPGRFIEDLTWPGAAAASDAGALAIGHSATGTFGDPTSASADKSRTF